MEQRRLGIPQFLSAVNLGDFAQMVGSEARMIAGAAGIAFAALPRLPFGPLVFLGGMLMVAFRALLLVFVVVVFGTGIAVISLARGIMRLTRGGSH
ncbi:MAG: hypothetical protein WEE64_11465 [Dehalococcoidia bacterium]